MITRALLILSAAMLASPRSDDAAQLRAHGPAALEGLLARRDALAERRVAARPGEIGALDALIDQVGAQKGCSVSRLYWYTDFDQALAAARASGKPVLSLRMLGKLTDDLSCANSRFFRATLYSNRAISKVMRERFVLHWASVRPVPVVTVDFGDGRKLHRTVTGNSIHWVLDSAGRVIDGLPGLHDPGRFLSWLGRSAEIAAILGRTAEPARAGSLIAGYHDACLKDLDRNWQAELAALAPPTPAPLPGPLVMPTAEEAGRLAHSKRIIERPAVAAITTPYTFVGAWTDIWTQIGARRASTVRFDDQSIAYIVSLNPLEAHAQTGEAAFGRLLAQLQTSVAIDAARNAYELHRTIHHWFVAAPLGPSLEALNDRVYDQLFLTPRRDPWLGLLTDGVFTAIADNGVDRRL